MAQIDSVNTKYKLPYFKYYQSNFDMKVLADMFTRKEFHDLCTYFLTFDLISAQVRKLSKYPIQPFLFSGGEKIDKIYNHFFEKYLDFGVSGHTLEEIGIEVLGYGNSFISLYVPFKRRFKCESCGKAVNVEDMFKKNKPKSIKVEQWGITGMCPKCAKHSKLVKIDEYSKSMKDKCSIVRWSIRQISIKYIKYSARRIYLYHLTKEEIRKIREERDPDYIEAAPWEIVYAAFNDKDVRFNDDQIFHMRGPSINGLDLAWGLPLILPAMLLILHIQQLRKANDVAAEDRTKAHDWIFPAATSGIESPAYMMNMPRWMKYVEFEIDEQRKDPARKSFSPIPLGKVTIGGDAKAYMVYPEIRQSLTEVAMALGMPEEFMFGGGQYSGSVVSHRFVEMFLGSMQADYVKLGNWICEKLQKIFDMPKTTVSMKKFKMADDVQLYQLYVQLLQMGMVDPQTFYDKTGLGDWDDIKGKLKEHAEFMSRNNKKNMAGQVDMERIQGLIQQKMQGMIQNEPGKPRTQNAYPEAVIQQLQQQGLDNQTIQQGMEQGMTPEQLVNQVQLQQQEQELAAKQQQGKTSVVVHRHETPAGAVLGQQETAPTILSEKYPNLLGGQQQEQSQQQEQQAQQQAQQPQQAQYPGPQNQVAATTPGQGMPANPDPKQIQQFVETLMGYPPAQQEEILSDLAVQNPAFYEVVMELMQQMNPQEQPRDPNQPRMQPMPFSMETPEGDEGDVDMTPLPNQAPPRRYR